MNAKLFVALFSTVIWSHVCLSQTESDPSLKTVEKIAPRSLKIIEITTPGTTNWNVPKGVTNCIVIGVGGGGGGGNGVNGGMAGTDTTFDGIIICRGGSGAPAKSPMGANGPTRNHFNGGNGGIVGNSGNPPVSFQPATKGEDSDSYKGGLGIEDNNGTAGQDGGGGGASSYGNGGQGGVFGGPATDFHPEWRTGQVGQGSGAGGGGAFAFRGQTGGGGGAGCKEQWRVFTFEKGTKKITCTVGAGGAGATPIPNWIDAGGRGANGRITILFWDNK